MFCIKYNVVQQIHKRWGFFQTLTSNSFLLISEPGNSFLFKHHEVIGFLTIFFKSYYVSDFWNDDFNLHNKNNFNSSSAKNTK